MSRKFIVLLIAGLFLLDFKVFANTLGKLPESLILLPEKCNAIVVEKSSQQVFLYSNDGQISNDLKFECSTGEAYGDKKRSGDKKTPEGIYFIKDTYEDKDLSPIYGKKAFPIDYPNLVDKLAGKTGNNIWLHGTNKVLKAMDSNGCVAMEDNNILALSKYIAINKTPVIIVDKLSMADQEKLAAKRKMILEWFKGWKDSINHGSYHDYLSFYDDSYLPDISWWKDWYLIRERTKKKVNNFSVILSQKGIYNQGNIYVIIFNMAVKCLKQNIDFGTRKLFVIEKNDGYKVIGDVYQEKKINKNKNPYPLVQAATYLAKNLEQGPDIIDIIQDWAKAWNDKNMEIYSSYYAKDFYSDGLNKQKWVQRKKDLAKRYDYIKVVIKDLQVNRGKKNILVKFLQDYKSSGFSAIGIKTLIFIHEDKGWKIYHESWKKK